ncbi:hypothetical protein AAMO2058_000462700 [Amorphochlora amoebiformis]
MLFLSFSLVFLQTVCCSWQGEVLQMNKLPKKPSNSNMVFTKELNLAKIRAYKHFDNVSECCEASSNQEKPVYATARDYRIGGCANACLRDYQCIGFQTGYSKTQEHPKCILLYGQIITMTTFDDNACLLKSIGPPTLTSGYLKSHLATKSPTPDFYEPIEPADYGCYTKKASRSLAPTTVPPTKYPTLVPTGFLTPDPTSIPIPGPSPTAHPSVQQSVTPAVTLSCTSNGRSTPVCRSNADCCSSTAICNENTGVCNEFEGISQCGTSTIGVCATMDGPQDGELVSSCNTSCAIICKAHCGVTSDVQSWMCGVQESSCKGATGVAAFI